MKAISIHEPLLTLVPSPLHATHPPTHQASVAVWESDEAEIVRNHFQDKLESRAAAGAVDSTISGTQADLSGAMLLSGHKDSLTTPVETDDSWMDEEETAPSSVPKPKSQKNKSKDKKKDKKKHK